MRCRLVTFQTKDPQRQHSKLLFFTLYFMGGGPCDHSSGVRGPFSNTNISEPFRTKNLNSKITFSTG